MTFFPFDSSSCRWTLDEGCKGQGLAGKGNVGQTERNKEGLALSSVALWTVRFVREAIQRLVVLT